MSTELSIYRESTLPSRAQYAVTLAGAADLIPRGLFDRQTGRPSPAKLLLVMETGAMLGLPPMAAIAGIDVIEGKAAIAPRVALGLLRARGHKIKTEESGDVETGDFKATVTLTRSDDPENPIVSSFTPQQALRAGLIDSYQPDPQTGLWSLRARSKSGSVLPWEAWTEDLCLWRAVGKMMRRGGQDVLMGLGYIPEEVEIQIDEDGARAVIDVATEDELVAEFKQFDDKAQMADLWKREHPMKLPSDRWTQRVQAEFDAHLSTLTRDSRNAPAEVEASPAPDQGPAVDVPAERELAATVTPDADPEPADGRIAADPVDEQEAWEAEQARLADEEYDREHAKRGPDLSALGA